MHVIRHAADTITFTIGTPDDGRQIGVQRRADRRVKNRSTVFGAENNVDEEK